MPQLLNDPEYVENLTPEIVIRTLTGVAVWLQSLPDNQRVLTMGDKVMVPDAHLAAQFMKLAMLAGGRA